MTDRPLRSRRRSGITLMETMIALGLLGTFVLVSTALINASLRVPREGSNAQSDRSRFDAALARLRGDVWSADGVAVAGDGALVVHLTDGRAVIWRVGGDGTWTRHAPRVAGGRFDDAQTWPAIAPGVTFRAAGPTLVVEFPETAGDDGGRVRLVSQVLLSAGESGAGGEGQ